MKRPTLKDVAKLAGVSPSTITRAFAEDSSISSHRKARVLDAARQLGYQPNAMAQSLRTTKSRLVGILLEEFANPLHLSILEMLTRKLQERGLHAITINAAHDISVDQATNLVAQYRIDGLIVSSDMPLTVEYECKKMNIPVVSFARSDRHIQTSLSIGLDDHDAGRIAAKHLLEKEYQRPAFLGGYPGVSVSQDRYAGFRDTLAEAGVLLRAAEFSGDNTYGRALDASRDLFNQRELPDSVFCVNDQIAVAAIDAAREVGLSIPNELGVIGVDNIWMAQTGSYNLTTVEQPLEEMAAAMAESLAGKERIGVDPLPPQLYKGGLIERNSTKRQRSK